MLLALVMLTQLDGSPIWIESNAVQIIKPSHFEHHKRQCGPQAGAAIRLGTVGLCVKETPDEIRRKIKNGS
jgi:hypothetical protein